VLVVNNCPLILANSQNLAQLRMCTNRISGWEKSIVRTFPGWRQDVELRRLPPVSHQRRRHQQLRHSAFPVLFSNEKHVVLNEPTARVSIVTAEQTARQVINPRQAYFRDRR